MTFQENAKAFFWKVNGIVQNNNTNVLTYDASAASNTSISGYNANSDLYFPINFQNIEFQGDIVSIEIKFNE